ncbi:GDP dissociation inhibitor [Artemisia annua]|uniref:Guanosine nucleotide diphosphate dissociation inhibitor n=1 Tax=Artemisia annua TaxID=35608 RepID=A0A2U1LN59_ARTAN|nr:GDP dissociation inhibitor [Artemisia annua]
MDEEYDAIVLGTGLKECILSGLLSAVENYKVLHMDRNDYYGGESTSLLLAQLWKRFKGSDEPPAELGPPREYNVDMFMMANGALVRVLIHTSVTKYLNFKAVDGSYVFNKGKIHKVPATDVEALKSPLMGLFEKRRARKFFIFVQDYDDNDPKSHEGMDLTKVPARDLISKKYGLDDNTIDFIGHSLALYRDDSYLDEPAIYFIKRVKLYAESLARFAGGSPYIYPLYGLGELPQAFARLSAVYGGTYMLNKPDCKVEFEDGKVVGVTSDGETAKCKKVVCDPSYLPDKVKAVGKVARAICIMSHPIPHTNEAHSAQVILPQKQLGRKSDMYLFCCSSPHHVSPKGKYIAFVTTEAETDDPETELKPGIDLLGPVDEIIFDTYDRYEPTNNSAEDNCFISTSYDATTHFESTVQDVLALYNQITGKTLDLSVDLDAASASEEQ